MIEMRQISRRDRDHMEASMRAAWNRKLVDLKAEKIIRTPENA